MNEPIFSVLAGKPGTCCITCTTETEGQITVGQQTCPAGFTSEQYPGAPGYYRCIRRTYTYTSIGCMDDPGAAYSACTASGGIHSYQFSPCP